eukprot:8887939-Karenia_brevis.AAC.1
MHPRQSEHGDDNLSDAAYDATPAGQAALAVAAAVAFAAGDALEEVGLEKPVAAGATEALEALGLEKPKSA